MIAGNPIQAILHELRLLPCAMKGMSRLGFSLRDQARYLKGRVFCPEENVTGIPPFTTPDGIPLMNRRDFVMYHTLFLLDEYQTSLWGSEFSREEAPIILDIGANLGMFSALCCTHNRNAQLHCFELIPELVPVIRQRLEASGAKDYSITQGAVGTDHGAQVAVRYDNPFTSTNSVDAGTGAHSATVPVVALDAWASEKHLTVHPFIAKIDVEGAENEVIKGGLKTLALAEYILIECHNSLTPLESFKTSHELLSQEKASPNDWICILKRRAG